MDDTVSTSREGAIIRAVVVVDLVAVVAGLDTLPDKAVTAACRLAATDASIGIDLVTIVTGLFAYLDDPVTTHREAAVISAAVVIVAVAIITVAQKVKPAFWNYAWKCPLKN